MNTEEIVAALKEILEEWNEQMVADLNGWSYRRGNNIFNEGAAAAAKSHIAEIEDLISKISENKKC
jgi:hypothetical protein